MSKYDDILVSVIMATKDTPEEYLIEAIETLLKQTHKNFELIIIDDASEKSIAGIIESFNDKRIKLITLKKNRGSAYARNQGLKIVKGKYTAILDSDDIVLPNRLEVEIDYMEKNLNIDICSTYVKLFGDVNQYAIFPYRKDSDIKAELFCGNCINHPTVMFRTSYLKENNISYDENFIYSQDYELWCRCSKTATFSILDRVELNYRIHKKQVSTAKRQMQDELCRKIYENNLKRLNIKNNKKYIDVLMYLSNRIDKSMTDKEILEFIKFILEQNKKLKVFDNKRLKQSLYYRYCTVERMRNKRIVNLKYMIYGKIISRRIRTILLEIKCKLNK